MTALHIFMREFKRYFLSPIGYFVMLGFLLFNGLIFYIIITIESQRYQSAATMDALTILMTGIIFMLTAVGVIPAITMHLFAEEKRSGTMEQLPNRTSHERCR
ncbi:MAG: hypothetical protein U5N86_06590 [Planctomycetota bacterium]|nr:hypothetical protein [Planctomycetota bacterium]